MTTLSLNQVLKQSSSYAQLPDYLSKEERKTIEAFKEKLNSDDQSKLTEALSAYDRCKTKIETILQEVGTLHKECSDLNEKMGNKAKALKKKIEELQAHGNRAEIAQLSSKITEILTTAGILVGILTTVAVSGPVGVSILGTGVGVGTFKLLTEKISKGIHDVLDSISKFAELTLAKKSDADFEKEKQVSTELSKKIGELMNKTKMQKRLASLARLQAALPHMTDSYADMIQSKHMFEECKTLIEKRIKELKDEKQKLNPSKVAGSISDNLKDIPPQILGTISGYVDSAKKFFGFVKDTTKEDKPNPENPSSGSPKTSPSKKSD